MAKKIDMTGWIMKEHGIPKSRLTVIEEDKEYKKEHNINYSRIFWKCQCECGNIKTISTQALRSGKTLSCGCYKADMEKTRRKTGRYKDLTGQRFGQLIVLENSGLTTKDKHVKWKCLCDCGTITYVPTNSLKAGMTKSCGSSLHRMGENNCNYKDLTGKKFGLLTVLSKAESENGKIMWLCECDCGKQIKVATGNLQSKNTFSCGCLHSSKGEITIKKILQENNIPFIQQYSFEDCLSPKNWKLRYDFYINNLFLLEYDGKQHYTDEWVNDFEYTKICDSIKNEYAKSHNIPLKRIPYWDLNKITLENIMSDKWLIN